MCYSCVTSKKLFKNTFFFHHQASKKQLRSIGGPSCLVQSPFVSSLDFLSFCVRATLQAVILTKRQRNLPRHSQVARSETLNRGQANREWKWSHVHEMHSFVINFWYQNAGQCFKRFPTWILFEPWKLGCIFNLRPIIVHLNNVPLYRYLKSVMFFAFLFYEIPPCPSISSQNW